MGAVANSKEPETIVRKKSKHKNSKNFEEEEKIKEEKEETKNHVKEIQLKEQLLDEGYQLVSKKVRSLFYIFRTLQR
jgi:phosphomevalonate kinase